MTDVASWPWSLATAVLALCLAAYSAVVSWITASRSTQLRKWLRAQLTTKLSETRLSAIEADQVELFSILQKLTTSTKRLSSRGSMQELREERRNAPPPPGASKAELRKFYGIAGVPGPEVARRQLRGEEGG